MQKKRSSQLFSYTTERVSYRGYNVSKTSVKVNNPSMRTWFFTIGVPILAVYFYIGSINLNVTNYIGYQSRAITDSVYICDSPTATSYHKKEDCKGLEQCTHDVDYIPLDDAKKKGRKPCKLCYPYEKR